MYALIELFLLFIISKKVLLGVSRLIYEVTNSKRLTVYVTSVLFLPGTFLHEMSHFIFALFTLVPVGEVDLVPELLDDASVRMGSVKIGKTDPVRNFFIAIAPSVAGIGAIGVISYFFNQVNIIVQILFIYLVFTISNTMFSSKKDMQEVWKLVVFLLILGIVIYFLGINLTSLVYILKKREISVFFENMESVLLFPLALDIVLLFILGFIKQIRQN